MTPYKREDGDKDKQEYRDKEKYSQKKSTDLKEDKYDKKMSRRLSIPEFVKKYKLDGDVGRD